MSTFDKMKAHEERRAAIKKQMEAMEAAAEPRMQTPSTTRRRTTASSSPTSRDSPGTVETARRFLVDEDDDVAPLNDWKQSHGVERRSLYETGPPTDYQRTRRKHLVQHEEHLQHAWLRNGESTACRARKGVNDWPKSTSLVKARPPSKKPKSLNIALRFVHHVILVIRRLILGLALAIGGTYQYTRSRWEMAMGNGRGKKLLIALVVIAVIVIPVSIVLTRDKSGGEKAIDYDLTPEERHDFILQRIVDSGISNPDDLATEGTPQKLALDWIVSGDHGELSHEHDYLLQRYALAVFFYATHGDFIFPPAVPAENITGDQEEGIEGHEDYDGAPAGEEEDYELDGSPDWINQNRWMSSYGICAWHGIQCHHRPGTDPTDNSFDDEGDIILVNMTDNNIRGTIPRELFIAHPLIRWLSLAGNGLFGTLPSEIGYLDDLRKFIVLGSFISLSIVLLMFIFFLMTAGYLSLSENEIGGSLPSEIVEMTSLSLFFADGNNFIGSIPSGIEKMTELGKLKVYSLAIQFCWSWR